METHSFNFLFKESIYPMAIVDHEMRFLNHSKLWLQDLGIKDSNIIGKTFYDVFPNTPEEIKIIHEHCLRHTVKQSKIQTITQSDGSQKWVDWQIKGWKEESKKLSGLLIVAEDITLKKRKEELLLNIQRVAKIGGWEFDFVANKAYLSDITKEIHELPLDYEMDLEKGLEFYKEGEHRDKITRVVNEAVTHHMPWDIETILITAKGNERWVRSIGECEVVDNKCIRIYGTFQDIDQKKRIELHNQEISERLTIATTDAANIGIWEYNIFNRKVTWDDNLYRIYGVTRDKFEETIDAWEAIIHPDDKIHCHNEIELAIVNNKKCTIEFRIIWPNGELRYIRSEFTISRYQNGVPSRLIGATWDITEAKTAEQNLKELLEVTSEQNDSLMNFAHIVSHNLRSHSSNLSMLTGFLTQEEDENEKSSLVKMLNDASISLNETVTHLSEVVHVKTNSEEKMKKTNLLKAIIAVEKNIRALLNEKEAVCNISVDASINIQAVPAYLDSILLNLFTNSIKYSSPKRKPIIDIKAEVKDDVVLFTFADNGLGINLEKHGKKLFGMYKTFHKNKDSKGIGLFITKNQIEAMNGKIEVESTEDIGTSFKLTFKKTIENEHHKKNEKDREHLYYR
ncbi:PAS domain-containing protein [Maribacter sp. TH_r10]|uniref:PAS domain-containing protein n=1 Tax=Maribacter sp. TH_r10 TaxID=3082086 RepID=UPI0029536FA7|nr:PAS domain-containing protein [Maribacter sp. TH_r10]MDV7137879.1 PAS domain-containing protein [Maribacter sp. TH_r10]